MHSPIETASLKDVESLIKLMAETVLAMEADQVFEV
jgi:putative aminopeptidase FrvX